MPMLQRKREGYNLSLNPLRRPPVQDSAGVKRVLGSVEGAVGQLRTAVVALELRPPVEGAGGLQQDTLQVRGGSRSCA